MTDHGARLWHCAGMAGMWPAYSVDPAQEVGHASTLPPCLAEATRLRRCSQTILCRQHVCVMQITRREIWQIHPQGARNLSRFGAALALQQPQSPHAVQGNSSYHPVYAKPLRCIYREQPCFRDYERCLATQRAAVCGTAAATPAPLACGQDISTASRLNIDRQAWQGQHSA